MAKINTIDLNIAEYDPIKTPVLIKKEVPINQELTDLVELQRETMRNIIRGTDDRKLFIVGPCSIHDSIATKEYAEKLKLISDKVQDKIYIAMRAYFEKPRTVTGWRGLISDPHIDGSFDVEEGYKEARKILRDILEIGLPIATELLEPITPQYIDDAISWAAIGARTIESPSHRLMISGLSIPAGFKNSTSGCIDTAINAVKSARYKGNFIGIDHSGTLCNIKTKGNQDVHIILRGGADGPNYSENYVNMTHEKLIKNDICDTIIIDCSHQNSNKDYRKQSVVLSECIKQIKNGQSAIKGFMLESNLKEGNQKIPDDLTGFDASSLEYGKSITDGCISIEETEKIIMDAYNAL